MNPKTAMLACLYLSSAAGLAAAQSEYASGLLHEPVGGAVLNPPTDRRLPVQNIGSSGQDGVDVKFLSVYGGVVSVDPTPLLGPSSGSREFRIRPKGWDGTIKGSMRLMSSASGALTGEVDFSAIGATRCRVTLRDAMGNVTAEFVNDGWLVAWEDWNTYNPGESASWGLSAGKANFQDMHITIRYDKASPKLFMISGAPVLYSDVAEMTFTPEVCPVEPCPPPPPDWPNLLSMEITGDSIPDLVVADAALDWSWGASNPSPVGPGSAGSGAGRMLCWGMGQGRISEEDWDSDGDGVPDERRLRTSNIGSSGQDGVSIDMPDGADVLGRKWGNGHVTLMKAYDDGEESRSPQVVYQCVCTYEDGTCEMQVAPDFSGVGSTQCTVQCLDGYGNPLITEILSIGQAFAFSTCDPYADTTWTTSRSSGSGLAKTKETIEWRTAPTTVTLPSGASQPGVWTVVLTAAAPISSVGHLKGLAMTSGDGTDIVVGRLKWSRTNAARYASGILHEPIGLAEFGEPTERRLPVHNLGSSGQDGVDVKLYSVYGGVVSVDATPLVQSSSSSELRIRPKGWDGTIKGHLRTTRAPGGAIEEECDMTPTGAVALQVTCRDAFGNAVATFEEPGAVLTWTDGATYDVTETPQWNYGAGKVNVQDISIMKRYDKASPMLFHRSSGDLAVADVVEVSIGIIICITEPCPPSWPNLQSMLVTARGLPDIDVMDEALDWSWGATQTGGGGGGGSGGSLGRVLCWGANNAPLTEEIGDLDQDGLPDVVLIAANIGSSGQDGVSIDLGPAPEGVSLRSKRCPDCPPGHVTLMKITDDVGGEARLTSTEDPLAGGEVWLPDFSSLGSTDCVATTRDEFGNILDSRVLTGGTGVGTCCVAASGAAAKITCRKQGTEQHEYFTVEFHFTAIATFSDGSSASDAKSISFKPLIDAWDIPKPVSVRVTSPSGDVVVGDIQIDDTPAPCDPIDFNNDGIYPDIVDLLDFLNVFAGGACSTSPAPGCNDTDFNNDGIYPDIVDLETYLAVFSGGTC